MIRVAAVADYIIENWQGPKLHRERILTTLLLHDIGKPVRNLDNADNAKDEDKAGNNRTAAEFAKRYGNEEHVASFNIAYELGVNLEVCRLILNVGVPNNKMIAENKDWNLKVCSYADQRVAPYGIVSLQERFSDFKKRYEGTRFSIWNFKDQPAVIEAAFEIEKQVTNKARLKPQQITNEAVARKINLLPNFIIRSKNMKKTV
jgi:hypothetical protein